MFKNLTKKQIIIIVVVGVVVIGLIIFLVMRNKKKKKEKEIMDAEIKNFVPEPLSKEDANNYFVPARKSQVIPQEDLKNESSKVTEATVKSINRPAQSAQSAQQKPQGKQQPIPSGKKEVPFTPIMEEDRELVEEMNKADQDKRPGMSTEN